MRMIEAAVAVISDGTKIFVTRQGSGESKDLWGFPGGEVGPGETSCQTLARVILDEFAVRIEVGELMDSVEHEHPDYHLTLHCHLCTLPSQLTSLPDHDAARWLSFNDLDSVEWLPSVKTLIPRIRSIISEQSISKVLDFSSEMGRLMLENGAEISRVEETMTRISSYYGVDSSQFFVLSNGIFTTGRSFAKVIFVPFKGTQLQKVAAANQLSRDVEKGKYTLEAAGKRLAEIRSMKGESALIQILSSALGSGCFCAIFGGSVMDCAAALLIGMLLWIFVLLASRHHISKVFTDICGGMIVTLLCILSFRIGFGDTFSRMLVGSLIPLVPGVPFINGIKDIANEDYIAGATRLLDALLVFFCIAMGVSIVLMAYGHIMGGMSLL